MARGLTFTSIFESENLNYNDTIGNVAEIKKINRGNGDRVSYMSRQAMRYDISRLGEELFGWNLQVVDKSKGTVQFREDLTIKESAEMDLFGYMKTIKSASSISRKGCVRVTHSISLEPFVGDTDFLSNKGFADRVNEFPNIVTIEQHKSLYTYTVTIDLDRVGIDNDIKLSTQERIKRVHELLDIFKILNRNIRGTQQNLSPLFVIGGVYNVSNPFFLGRIKLKNTKGTYEIDTKPLESTMPMSFGNKTIKESTSVGLVNGIFSNEDEISSLTNNTLSIEDFFEILKVKVEDYYTEGKK